MKTCGVALVELLIDHGIDHVFGIPGVHTVELYRGLAGSGIRHVTPRHEQGAGFMADGFARASGRPAACFIITGPGMTNISTPMGQAYGDSVPMLVISAVNQRHELGMGLGVLHELSDQRALVRNVAAFSHTLQRPDELPAVIDRAFAVFEASRPRPVHIELPLDVIDMPADEMRTTRGPRPSKPAPDATAIALAAERLRAAKRPVIAAGGGAVGANDALRRLAELIDAPTALTSNAKGLLPPHHPLLLNGYSAGPGVGECFAEADVVLAIGTEIGETDYGFEGSPTFPGAMIRIDIESDQTTRNAQPEISIVADATLAIERLCEAVGKPMEREQTGAARTARATSQATRNMEARFVRHLRMLEIVREVLPDSIIVGDSTEPVYSGQTHFAANGPRSWFCSSTGFGTLGYALPAAIGAKLACPDRPVVAIVGDGGLMYTVAEMASAVGAETPIICLLWNNQAYMEIRHAMIAAQVAPVGVDLHSPDFVALAHSMGWEAERVPRLEALGDLLALAATRSRSTLIELTEETYAQGSAKRSAK